MEDPEKTDEQPLEPWGEPRPGVTDSEKNGFPGGIGRIIDNLRSGMIYQVVLKEDKARWFTFLSNTVRLFYGITPEEGMADPSLIYNRVHEEDRLRLFREEEEAIRNLSPFRSEVRMMDPKGGVRWSLFVSHPRRLSDDSICWDGIEIDITELKQREEILRGNESRFRTLFEDAPVAITLTRRGFSLYSNLKLRELFGITVEDSLGGNLIDYFAPSHREASLERIQRRMQGLPTPSSFESVGLRKDGSEFLMSVELKQIQLEDGPAYLAFITDITDRKRMEEERIIMSKLESTGILAGGIAHDFNNLLSIILGNLELFRISPSNGLGQANLEAVEKAAKAAQGLTRQLITFAKGGAPIKKKVNLSALLQEQATFSLRGSPVGVQFSIPSDLWQTEVDENQIGQVVRNIILNAREAMAEGGMVQVVAENVLLKEPSEIPLPAGNYVKVTITDRGKGIPEEILPKIFDPYFSTKQRGDQKGMGLGLTICHSVIQKHGGTILVNSRTDEGASFQIYLPALMDGINDRPAQSDRPTGPGRILVMDDEEMMRDMIRIMLSRLGFEVVLVEDGNKAIEAYQQARAEGKSFGAAILDLTIPGGMGGVKTIQGLGLIDPGVKAIVLSGYDHDTVLQNYEQYGFKRALSKPFSFNQLRETLLQVLGQAEKDPR